MPIKGRIFAILVSYYDDYDDHNEVPRLNWELIRKPYSVELSPSNITDEEFEIFGTRNRTATRIESAYRLILIL